MSFILRYTADKSEGIGKWCDYEGPHYFANLGGEWPHDPTKRLIARTVRDKSEAKQFATEAEANEVLVRAGHPKGWEAYEL